MGATPSWLANIVGKADPDVVSAMRLLYDRTAQLNSQVAQLVGASSSTSSQAAALQATQESLSQQLGQLNALFALAGVISPTKGTLLQFDGSQWVPVTNVQQSFSNLTPGTNTSGALVVGSGSSLTPTGSGIIEANELDAGLGVGNGASASLTSPAKGTGSGPASLAVVQWGQILVSGTLYWIPLFQ